MLGNCEKKMTATNQWALPQDQIVDDQNTFMASTLKGKVMEKTSLQEHQRQLPLKCPRCDSSNTKFCYYNNYSLSQPRHFCKACKRYWTRGGTLRNVPVGGGCRKNKRVVKRPAQPSNGGDGISTANSTATTSSSLQQQIDLSSLNANHINNSMFYGPPANYPALNFPFSRFSSPRVTSDCNGFDFHLPQINGLGLGFFRNNEYKDGFNPVKKIEDVISTSNSSVAIDPIFFGSSTMAASTSTMPSLLASSLQHQKYVTSGLKDITPAASSNFPGLMPFNGMQMPDENAIKEKEYKLEAQNRLDWNLYPFDQQIDSTYDSASSLLWNTSNNAGSWFDPSNVGSSVLL